MSTTANEYEEPGGNYPDNEGAEVAPREEAPTPPDAGPDHHGQDGGRETLTASEAQRAMAGAAEQDAPAMEQNNATDEEKVRGIVAQTRVDVRDKGPQEIARVLAQRFEQSGIAVPDGEIARLVEWVQAG